MSLKNLLDKLLKEGKIRRQDTAKKYLKEKNPQLELFDL